MPFPNPESRWRHHSGTIYVIYDVTNLAATDERFPVMVSYYSEAEPDIVWSRPWFDFLGSCEPVLV